MPESDSKPPKKTASSATSKSDNDFDVDTELVKLAQAGRHSAFELLVVKYQRRIAATISAIIRDDAITEELVQEVFLRAFRSLSELRDEVVFFAWLQAIARNLARSFLRQRVLRSDSVQDHDERRDGSIDAIADQIGESQVPSSTRRVFANTPEDELIAKQLFQALERALHALPPQQRDALLMREIDGLDYQAIAVSMALPLNTVKSLIYRARESIALQLGPQLEPSRSRRW